MNYLLLYHDSQVSELLKLGIRSSNLTHYMTINTGASKDLKGNNGETALSLAQEKNFSNIIALLTPPQGNVAY